MKNDKFKASDFKETNKGKSQKKSRTNGDYGSRGDRPRRNSKRRPKETEVDISDFDINKADLKGIKKSTENDGSWYSHYPELVQSFGSVPFSYPLGTEIPLKSVKIDASNTMTYGTKFVPGAMALDWYPVIGQAKGYAADPINQAANKIYVYVRHTLSTYAQYDAPDMMMYILAMDSIYTLYSELVRVYGVALNWKVLNRYYATAMIEALGFESTSVLDNLAAFRGQINEIAYMLNQFVVPAGFDYITRHTWMAGNLFYDGEAAKSQTYFYRMGGFYELIEVTEGPMYLRFTNRFDSSDTPLTVTQAVNQLKRAIALVMNSQDCIAMSGDLLKAFGPSGTFVAIPVAENYIVEPIYSAEVLSQIENASVRKYPFNNNSSSDPWTGDIKQMTLVGAGPNIKQTVQFSYATNDIHASTCCLDFILNFHKQDVSPIDVMVASRLSSSCSSVGRWPLTGTATDYLISPDSLGSEVIAKVTTFGYTRSATTIMLEKTTFSGVSSSYNARQLNTWFSFDWAPRIGLITSAPYAYWPLLDFDNYAVLTEAELAGLHSTALMSLFEVPAIASLQKTKFEPRKKSNDQ